VVKFCRILHFHLGVVTNYDLFSSLAKILAGDVRNSTRTTGRFCKGVIYEFDAGSGRIPKQIDLRSDGSGIGYDLYDYTHKLNQFTILWTLSQDDSVVWVGREPFKPEGDDLIDSKGNRWERQR
jgi:hypothetical protein